MGGQLQWAAMATVKRDMLTKTGEWWRHLRWAKRVFWKGERQAGKKLAAEEIVTRDL